jgi:hypothetical protein
LQEGLATQQPLNEYQVYFGLAENLRTGTTTLDDLRNLGLNEQQF